MKNKGILILLSLTLLNSVFATDEAIIENQTDIMGLNSFSQGNLVIEDNQKEDDSALPSEFSKIII